ncbi:beta-ketoacyl-ACP synthase 3 [Actinokineospora sp. PR83]|uniref:beta-ketoacyl-ACP synthase 3 n=1 Tax=Actinokineospora sp. PR83 TaxID=2884908 RepID=UPI001F15FBDC|nr:beta-ketoacyl-ACP synthase 3 [Actinokineospora sp. PR83]MCG8914481.1 beta-ketoacyl-ACP synthase 3 [Actinokineospora sp. PR83]
MQGAVPAGAAGQGRRVAVVAGIGGHTPSTVVTNAALSLRFDTSDEWIRSRTGIGARHVAEPGEATSDLAVRAGAAALRSAAPRSGGDGVDLLLLATSTPDHPCPATAPAVATRLGLSVPALDVNAVCSGFVYGLAVADGLIAGGVAERVLLIGADTFSTILDPDDRSAAALFGDGAGAVVLRAGHVGEPGAVQAFDLGSDGDLADLVMVREGGSRHPGRDPGAERSDRFFAMRGQAVYRHAVARMTESARSVLDRVGWAPGEVDRFVAHQANARILATVGTELGVPADRVYANLGAVGNTVAASIPLALAHAAEAGELHGGDRVLLSAFGGGATWGAAALTWPELF